MTISMTWGTSRSYIKAWLEVRLSPNNLKVVIYLTHQAYVSLGKYLNLRLFNRNNCLSEPSILMSSRSVRHEHNQRPTLLLFF
jgi:hypothetical protein